MPTARPSQGKARILRVAEELFARRGYAGVSMALVAQRARVSKASVFHHFSTKDDLYRAILIAAAADFRDHVVPSLSFANGVEPALHQFFVAHLESWRDHPWTLRMVTRELAEAPASRRRALRDSQITTGVFALVADLRRAQEQSHIGAELDAEAIAMALLAAGRSITEHAEKRSGMPFTVTTDKLIKQFSKLLSVGLTP